MRTANRLCTIQDVIMSRIDRLEAGPKQTLQLASVIGREFGVRLLETIAELGEPLTASLSRLRDLEFIDDRSVFPEHTCRTPRYGWAGGVLTLGALGAVIVSHLTVLGIEIQSDHGLLSGMAVVTFICGFIVTYIHRNQIPAYASLTPY
jgi:hypothetical protein